MSNAGTNKTKNAAAITAHHYGTGTGIDIALGATA
jgi:hypothetical protein